jgi:hypothetical protein
MTDLATLFGWLKEKRLLAVSFSWKFGKGGKPAKIEWIGAHKKKEKSDERNQRSKTR